MKRPWVIHPFLVAIFPTLFLYSRNLGVVDPVDMTRPMALSLAATLLGFLALKAARLDSIRVGLILSGTLLLFFSFSLGVRLTSKLGPDLGRSAGQWATLAIEALIGGGWIGLILRKPGLGPPMNAAANAGSMALIGLTTAGLVGPWSGAPSTRTPVVAAPVELTLSAGPEDRPDVYFLVLDAYGRSDVLKALYGFDNSAFLDRLGRKGFVVARQSRANYCQTALSLAATLNFRYLDDLGGNRSHDRLPLRRLIAENATFRAFRQQGYRVVSFASGFDATEKIPGDLEIAPAWNLPTFPALVADQTPLWLLLGRRSEHEPHRMHRERILKIFEDLPTSTHPSAAPTFTFAHVLSPHPPFVFGADGEDVSGAEKSYTLNDSEGWCQAEGHDGSADYVERYRKQITYLTARVELAIDQILATSRTPPIIIVQGDHGPGAHFDSGLEQPNAVPERFGILNACLIPEPARKRIGSSSTPVNTFRIVLDECLGANLSLLEDRSFYSAYMTPYVFVEVPIQ